MHGQQNIYVKKYKALLFTRIAGNYFNCNIFWREKTLDSATYWIQHHILAFKSIRRPSSLRKYRYILVDIFAYRLLRCRYF